MASTRPAYKSLFGRRLGLGPYNELMSANSGSNLRLTSRVATATITVSAEGATVANQRNISITLKDANGVAINYAETFEIVLYSSSAMTDFVGTGGSTGIAAGASGKILAVIAKKLFRAITTTAGVCEVIYTDTGTDAGYLAVRLPNGNVIAGGDITNA